jgi:hypothetical protein
MAKEPTGGTLADSTTFIPAQVSANGSGGAWVQLSSLNDGTFMGVLYSSAAFNMVIVPSGTSDATAATAEATANRVMIFNAAATHGPLKLNPSRTWLRMNGASASTVHCILM